MTRKREKDIEAEVRLWARDRGFLVRKFTSPGKRAVLDRVFVSPQGVVLFIEFKAHGGKPTAAQWREIRRFRNNHAYAEWFDDAERAIAYLSRFLPQTVQAP